MRLRKLAGGFTLCTDIKHAESGGDAVGGNEEIARRGFELLIEADGEGGFRHGHGRRTSLRKTKFGKCDGGAKGEDGGSSFHNIGLDAVMAKKLFSICGVN